MELTIRTIPELLKVFRNNADGVVLWQLPLESVDELMIFHKLFSSEERYVLKGLLIDWGIKPNEYLKEPIWNILDNIIDFYENDI